MSQFLAWFSFGGYGPYVWSAYGLMCGVLALTWVRAKKQQRRIHQQLRTWFQRS